MSFTLLVSLFMELPKYILYAGFRILLLYVSLRILRTYIQYRILRTYI